MESQMHFEVVANCPDATPTERVIGMTVFAADANALAIVAATAYSANTVVYVRKVGSEFMSFQAHGTFRGESRVA